MCIIIAKPAGVAMPTEQIMENCFNANPDGAGIMLAANDKVYGFKGLMDFKAFRSKLKKLRGKFGNLDKLPVVMHFRIGTHGSNNPANTHPFPISASYDDLRAVEWTAPLGVAHNGIISCTQNHTDIKVEDVSDTMVFIRRIIAPVAALGSVMKRKEILEAFRIAAGSKLAFIDRNGTLEVLGDFNKSDGIYYSNYTWHGAMFRYYDYAYYADHTYRKLGSTASKKNLPASANLAKNTDTRLWKDEYVSFEEELENGDYMDVSGWTARIEDFDGQIKTIVLPTGYVVDCTNGDLLKWNDRYGYFSIYAVENEYEFVTE